MKKLIEDQQAESVHQLCSLLSDITPHSYSAIMTPPFVQIYMDNEKHGSQMRVASAVRRLCSLLQAVTNAD